MPGDLTGQVLAIRNDLRSKTGKELLPQPSRPADPTAGTSSGESTERPADPAARNREMTQLLSYQPVFSQTPQMKDWHRVVHTLQVLEPVYTWGFEEYQDGENVFVSLMQLEQACIAVASKVFPRDTENLATEHKLLRDAYNTQKSTYLQAVGRLCELYLQHNLKIESLDIFSVKFGLKTIRITVQHLDAGTADPAPTFTAREIPMLLLSSPQEILRLINIKETFPGAAVLSA